jgi:hypothetical protein
MFSSQIVTMDELVYFRERNRNRCYSAIISLFSKLVEKNNLTKRELAFRLDKEPAQITRWLAGSGNWTLDTVSDLSRAMGYEPEYPMRPINALGIYSRPIAHPLLREPVKILVFQLRSQLEADEAIPAGVTGSSTTALVNPPLRDVG